MQVKILPAVPLPGGVKGARRFVKPHGVGASPTLAANLRKAGRYKLAAPVPKTGSAHTRGRSITDAFRQFQNINKRNPVKSVMRYQSQLLYRRSYKPRRAIRIHPTQRLNIAFRPARRFGSKPEL